MTEIPEHLLRRAQAARDKTMPAPTLDTSRSLTIKQTGKKHNLIYVGYENNIMYYYLLLPEHECIAVLNFDESSAEIVKAIDHDAPYFVDGDIISVNSIMKAAKVVKFCEGFDYP